MILHFSPNVRRSIYAGGMAVWPEPIAPPPSCAWCRIKRRLSRAVESVKTAASVVYTAFAVEEDRPWNS